METPVGKHKIKCARSSCGHEWYTKSKSKYVSCPLCNYNNKLKSPPPTKKVKCARCLHEWKTRSKLRYVTCPNCRYNNKIVDAPAKQPRPKQPRPKAAQVHKVVKPHKKKQPSAVQDVTPQDAAPEGSELDWMREKEKREIKEKKESELEWMKSQEETQDG